MSAQPTAPTQPQVTTESPATTEPPNQLSAFRQWSHIPASEPIQYSVVIPAYNEEERILPTIGAIAAHLCALGESWELIVADDGSTDDTVKILEEQSLINMRVLKAVANGGKGSAVRRGVLVSRGRYVLFADADQSTPIEQFERLLGELKAGADVVIGSRSAEGAIVTNKSTARKVLSKGLNLLVTHGFGVDHEDTQCGFKLFTADAARTLFQRQLMDEFSFDLEILYLADKLDMQVAEVPVEWIDAPGSTVDPGKVALEFLRDMAIIRWNDLLGRYKQVNHHRSKNAVITVNGQPETAVRNEMSKVATDAD